MSMVILFDGPDKVGKTEMVKELSKRLNVPSFKNKIYRNISHSR
jgi:hypothetical protein